MCRFLGQERVLCPGKRGRLLRADRALVSSAFTLGAMPSRVCACITTKPSSVAFREAQRFLQSEDVAGQSARVASGSGEPRFGRHTSGNSDLPLVTNPASRKPTVQRLGSRVPVPRHRDCCAYLLVRSTRWFVRQWRLEFWQCAHIDRRRSVDRRR